MVVRRSTLIARPVQAVTRMVVGRVIAAIVLLLTMWTCTAPYTKAYATSFDARCALAHVYVFICVLDGCTSYVIFI